MIAVDDIKSRAARRVVLVVLVPIIFVVIIVLSAGWIVCEAARAVPGILAEIRDGVSGVIKAISEVWRK